MPAVGGPRFYSAAFGKATAPAGAAGSAGAVSSALPRRNRRDIQLRWRFGRNNAGDVGVQFENVPGVLGTMASLAEAGVTHVHFNADHGSEGYYLPLVQLPIVWRHLQRQGLLPRDAG